MCLAFLVFGCSAPQPLLILAFNRDEFFERPTQPLHMWEDGSGLLAGRDLDGGGTWLGVNVLKSRVAFLTNLRSRDPVEPSTRAHTHTSRGELPTGFLNGDASPQDFAQYLRADQYHGFNLVVGDLRGDPGVGAFVYTNNALDDETDATGGGHRGSEASDGDSSGCRVGSSSNSSLPNSQPNVQLLEPGRVYGLSNGVLMEWPKVTSGVQVLQGLLPSISQGAPVPWGRIFEELLGDSRRLVARADAAAGVARQGGEVTEAGAEAAGTAAAAAAASASRGASEDATSEGLTAGAPRGEVGPVGPACWHADEYGSEAQRRRQDGEGAAGAAGAGGASPSPGVVATAAAGVAEGAAGVSGGDAAGVVDGDRFCEELEHITSGRYVEAVLSPYGLYGTRSQTVIVVWHDGSSEVRERNRHEDGVWREAVVPFRMDLDLDLGEGENDDGSRSGV